MRWESGVFLSALLYFLMAIGSDSPCAAAELSMVLESSPPGAKVEHAGRILGKTPLELSYPKGYFASRGTVWGAYLGAPLEFTLTLPGYEPKEVKLGSGPHPWRNLYGQIVYQYYLLDRSYRIELNPERAEGSGSGDTVGQLERLAKLRESGALSEEEFIAAKAKLLAGGEGAVAVPAPVTPNRLDGVGAETLCLRLAGSEFTTATLAKPLMARKEISSPIEGDSAGRDVTVWCSWQLAAPRRAELTVKVSCGAHDPAELCKAAGQPEVQGSATCVWGTQEVARAVAHSGCMIEASLKEDARSVPGANPVAPLDARELARIAAGRI
jgi:hypothetical protein